MQDIELAMVSQRVYDHALARARARRWTSGVGCGDEWLAVLRPPELLKCLPECREERRSFQVVLGIAHQHADASHALWLLRPRHERPRGRRAAEQRDERATPHSMTSSAATSKPGGTVRPSAL